MSDPLDNLVLNERMRVQAKHYLAKPAHALLINAPTGSGKFVLAQNLAASLLGLSDAKQLNSYPYYTHLAVPEGKQDIPIEAVRDMIASLRLRVPSPRAVNRVVIIENANTLSIEAQNALLKTLEEPPAGSALILTSVPGHKLLPTVVSRAQELAVDPVSLTAAKEYFAGKHTASAIESAWRLSGGTFGLLSALLSDSTEHPLKIAVEEIKAALSKPIYERIILFEQLSRDKYKLSNTLEAAARVLTALHHNAVTAKDKERSSRLLKSRKEVVGLRDRLAANASPRLIALELALNLGV